MQYILYGIIFILICLLCIKKKNSDNINKEIELLEQQKMEIADALDKSRAEYMKQCQQYQTSINAYYEISNQLQSKIDSKQSSLSILNEQVKNQAAILNDLTDNLKETAQKQVEEYKCDQLVLVNSETSQWYAEQMARLQLEVQKFESSANDEREKIFLEMSRLLNELNDMKAKEADFKSRQDAINTEIMRQRKMQEQEEFYKIQLPSIAIDDIELLKSIRQNLHNRENLDKMIYDTYLNKPVNEMIKRVLEGKAPSGIYKITRLKTGEIYIGKSTDIKSRWQQHAKTAMGCGTIAHSMLHTTIEKDGIENFTWELLEEVSKDKLTEREKYYINFYNSKNYGLNEREG